MTEQSTKQFTEYLIREVARRIVPLALEKTGDVECLHHAKALRGLPDDASMSCVARVCDDATATAIADAALYSADADTYIACSAAARVADDAGYVEIYAAILIDASKLLPANAVPIIPLLHKRIYAAVTTPGQSLEMEVWHTCKTTHCTAGWATVLGGYKGKALEYAFGTAIAGGLIYAVNTGMVPDFYETDNVSAMANIEALAR